MTNPPTVTIIRTGVANTASLAASFTRLGLACKITEDRKAIEDAELLVLPGVGSIGSGAARLDALNIREILRARIGSDRPMLSVCLGMQLLAEASQETPGAKGLGVIPGQATRFSSALRVPQMGWNEVTASLDGRILQSGTAYFANSFRLTESPAGWIAAYSDYDGPFVAALERNRTLACQFHPELSGEWGTALLARWAGVPGIAPRTTPSEAVQSC